MQKKTFPSAIASPAAIGSLCILATLTGSVAVAGEYDGWTFARDSFNDETGGPDFEIYGVAFKQEGNIFSFAFNANTARTGVSAPFAFDGNIGWGDLIFSAGGSQYGVKFADNDSGVTELGLYADITTKDVTFENFGWDTQRDYAAAVALNGGTPVFFGDDRDTAFFNDTSVQQAEQVIATGTKVGDIADLDASELLDFSAAFGGVAVGAHTFGFSFELAFGMTGNFLMHVLLECINDGIALDGTFLTAGGSAPIGAPEPGSAIALGLMAAIATGTALRRRSG